MVETKEESAELLEEEETTSARNFTDLVEIYAQCVLRLDDAESPQFVSDFEDVASQLGFEPGEVSVRVGVKILCYLSLERMLGLSIADPA